MTGGLPPRVWLVEVSNPDGSPREHVLFRTPPPYTTDAREGLVMRLRRAGYGVAVWSAPTEWEPAEEGA